MLPAATMTMMRRMRGAMLRLVRQRMRVRPVTFVMHQFMDADVVAPAWEMMRRGKQATEPRLRETQERLDFTERLLARGKPVPEEH